jgi:hypothetical protein
MKNRIDDVDLIDDDKAYYNVEIAHEEALCDDAWFMMTSVEVAHREAFMEEKILRQRGA